MLSFFLLCTLCIFSDGSTDGLPSETIASIFNYLETFDQLQFRATDLRINQVSMQLTATSISKVYKIVNLLSIINESNSDIIANQIKQISETLKLDEMYSMHLPFILNLINVKHQNGIINTSNARTLLDKMMKLSPCREKKTNLSFEHDSNCYIRTLIISSRALLSYFVSFSSSMDSSSDQEAPNGFLVFFSFLYEFVFDYQRGLLLPNLDNLFTDKICDQMMIIYELMEKSGFVPWTRRQIKRMRERIINKNAEVNNVSISKYFLDSQHFGVTFVNHIFGPNDVERLDFESKWILEMSSNRKLMALKEMIYSKGHRQFVAFVMKLAQRQFALKRMQIFEELIMLLAGNALFSQFHLNPIIGFGEPSFIIASLNILCRERNDWLIIHAADRQYLKELNLTRFL